MTADVANSSNSETMCMDNEIENLLTFFDLDNDRLADRFSQQEIG